MSPLARHPAEPHNLLMEPVTAIFLAIRTVAFPILLIAALLALVFGPVFLMRFAADRTAAARRKLSDPRGGRLIVTDDSRRLSPTAVPSSRPLSVASKSGPIFTALRALSVFSGIGGLLTTSQFPGELLPVAALLAGFPGFLLVQAFEERYMSKLKAPNEPPDDAPR